MDLPFPNAARVPLLLSRRLADRLVASDEPTYGRVCRAVAFAEVALGLFHGCHWSASPAVPIFEGILLDVRFHRPSERFFVLDFVDLADGHSPSTPGGTRVPVRSRALDDLLFFAGIRPDEAGAPPVAGDEEAGWIDDTAVTLDLPGRPEPILEASPAGFGTPAAGDGAVDAAGSSPRPSSRTCGSGAWAGREPPDARAHGDEAARRLGPCRSEQPARAHAEAADDTGGHRGAAPAPVWCRADDQRLGEYLVRVAGYLAQRSPHGREAAMTGPACASDRLEAAFATRGDSRCTEGQLHSCVPDRGHHDEPCQVDRPASPGR